MLKLLMRIFGLDLSDEDIKTHKLLNKYGGKIVVGDRGGFRHEFPSKELENAYWQEVLKETRRGWRR
ncbi:hypothetical protein VP249E411_P0027 [Vibrio phage 249E41-1]|nr:hypothetical protein VP249E411_P0027 [Vibrio phage 249E41-1]CAH9012164.1 hypothetical protein VP495E541_P0031 [Vibrio phage 495E54-1]CAH9012244.1 hypothetical protein VP496E541_P0031 [Vibrio phage 496E54-1]